MVEESCFDELDRSFFNASSWMADFFSGTYGALGYRLVTPLDPNKFDNATSKVKEIGIRVLIALGALVSFCFAGTYLLLTAVVLSIGSKIFRCIGFAFQKNGFTHIRGSAPEISLQNRQTSLLTWNLRGYHLHYPGVIHWHSRVDAIVESIQRENPDTIVLQDIYDTAFVEALIEKLGAQYAHFYTHLGANTLGNSGGCMVITKCGIHQFTHADFANNDWKNTRGFEFLEIKPYPEAPAPCFRIIGTQLSPGKESQEKRIEQVSQIITALSKESSPLPTLFAADANDDRNSAVGTLLSKYLYHSYRDKEPTYSPQLAKQWAPIFEGQEESRDFISLVKRTTPEGKTLPVIERDIQLIDCHLLRAFEQNPNTMEVDTKTARSDSHGVYTLVSY